LGDDTVSSENSRSIILARDNAFTYVAILNDLEHIPSELFENLIVPWWSSGETVEHYDQLLQRLPYLLNTFTLISEVFPVDSNQVLDRIYAVPNQ